MCSSRAVPPRGSALRLSLSSFSAYCRPCAPRLTSPSRLDNRGAVLQSVLLRRQQAVRRAHRARAGWRRGAHTGSAVVQVQDFIDLSKTAVANLLHDLPAPGAQALPNALILPQQRWTHDTALTTSLTCDSHQDSITLSCLGPASSSWELDSACASAFLHCTCSPYPLAGLK